MNGSRILRSLQTSNPVQQVVARGIRLLSIRQLQKTSVLKLSANRLTECAERSGQPIRWNSGQTDSQLAASSAQHRTNVSNPRNHTEEQLGRIYTVDPQVPKLFGEELNSKQNKDACNYFAPRQWVKRNEVFDETGIMVREPALEVINCINRSDLTQPAIRYVLYGNNGCGKSITLAHLIDYGWHEGFVVMPFAQIKKWLSRYYEVAPSTYNPGQIDHIVNSNILLKNFRQANLDRLDKCVTHKDYSFSARDKFQKGSPLLEVIDLGCDRLAFAADCLNVVIKELKLNCNDGNCKLMVVCDGVNALFAPKTMIHREKRFWENGPYKPNGDWMKNVAEVDECSVLRNIKKLLRNDYRNAVIVTSVDRNARVIKTDPAHTWWKTQNLDMRPDTASHLPFALLTQTGWEVMAPFYPVEVPKFTEAELDNMIDYYIEQRWIKPDCGSPSGRKEIHFLTGRNPGDFFQFSPQL